MAQLASDGSRAETYRLRYARLARCSIHQLKLRNSSSIDLPGRTAISETRLGAIRFARRERVSGWGHQGNTQRDALGLPKPDREELCQGAGVRPKFREVALHRQRGVFQIRLHLDINSAPSV